MTASGIDLMDLARQEKAIARDLERVAEIFIRKVLLLLFADLVRLTPVRTGRARNGWNVSLDSPSEWVPPEGDTYGAAAPPLSEASRFRLGMIAWIVNNVSYIGVLDEGWSQQAPAGMTSVAFANLGANLEAGFG